MTIISDALFNCNLQFWFICSFGHSYEKNTVFREVDDNIKTMKTSSRLLHLPFHQQGNDWQWCCVNAKLRWRLCPCCIHVAACRQHCTGIFALCGSGVFPITTLFAVIANIALALLPALRWRCSRCCAGVVALILLASLSSLQWQHCPYHTCVTASIAMVSLPYSRWCLPNCNATCDMLLYVMLSSCSSSLCMALSSYPTSL